MLIAEAQVQTEQPSRYLVQLCRHAQQIHRVRDRPHTHDGGDVQPPPEVQHVEWSETRGLVSFGRAQCTIQTTPGTLTLRAEATDEENLQRVQDIVAGDIERFGRRDHLTVNWQRREAPTVQLGQASYAPSGTSPGRSGPFGAVRLT
jgi:hypothetical protein